jgi:hypothetical protein
LKYGQSSVSCFPSHASQHNTPDDVDELVIEDADSDGRSFGVITVRLSEVALDNRRDLMLGRAGVKDRKKEEGEDRCVPDAPLPSLKPVDPTLLS